MRIRINLTDSTTERDIVLNKVPFPDSCNENPQCLWQSIEGDIHLKILENSDGSVASVEKSERIASDSESVIAQFLDQKQMMLETESSGIEFDAEEQQNNLQVQPQPYDPDLIRVDTRPFSLKQTYELIQEGDIDLSPDFQRHFVWKEIEKRSRLIESIMLRIPLPVFYLAQDREGKFQVVDGLQRLTVIKQFLSKQFKLKNLEYLKDCEGSTFDNLEAKYSRRITQAQLIMNIIDPQTPIRVKFEIFKRINQGGKPLRPQEIRNCMASSAVRTFMKELADSLSFKQATDYSVNSIRMEDHELILRFAGFYYAEYLRKGSFKYTGSMETFLDDTLDLLNQEDSEVLSVIKEAFLTSMNNAYHLFGAFAFRKCNKEHLKPGARKQFINKSLFTSWAVLLSAFPTANVCSKLAGNALNMPLAEEIEKYSEFYDAITNGTNDVNRMAMSFETARSIINTYLMV